MSAAGEGNRDGAMVQLLRVEKLSKNGILREVSFGVEQGEMAAIMGPSGSGKSTLLYNVSGMDRPDSGRVWLGDTEITSLTEDERAKLRLSRMGFVFQQMNMVANLNILDNILLPAIRRNKGKGGKSKAQIRQEAERLMEKLSISGLGEQGIAQVSGGELQRACICRSMINRPEILFADEPTGALNKGAATEVMGELARLNREGTGILMVTHDSRIASYCDRILYLLDGRICGELALGKPAAGEERRREQKVGKWLAGMGW